MKQYLFIAAVLLTGGVETATACSAHEAVVSGRRVVVAPRAVARRYVAVPSSGYYSSPALVGSRIVSARPALVPEPIAERVIVRRENTFVPPGTATIAFGGRGPTTLVNPGWPYARPYSGVSVAPACPPPAAAGYYATSRDDTYVTPTDVTVAPAASVPAPTVAVSSVSTNVQSTLARQGYYFGAIDGVMGPKTRSAIASYQADHGLAITGRINEHLLRSLGLS